MLLHFIELWLSPAKGPVLGSPTEIKVMVMLSKLLATPKELNDRS